MARYACPVFLFRGVCARDKLKPENYVLTTTYSSTTSSGGGEESQYWCLVCLCFSADYDRGPATARPVSPSQELWIVLGGVLRDSIRLLRKSLSHTPFSTPLEPPQPARGRLGHAQGHLRQLKQNNWPRRHLRTIFCRNSRYLALPP